MRVSTDKWARVSWLLCCVPPLSGIFGIAPKVFLFHHKTFRKGWEAQFCPPGLVGCYVNVVSILSLSDLWDWLSEKNGKHNFAGQSWLVVMLWSNYDIQTWKHGRYKSKYARVLVAMMCPSSISLVSQFPFTDNCRGHSLFVIDYNPEPPPLPLLPLLPVIDFVQYWLFARQSYSSG